MPFAANLNLSSLNGSNGFKIIGAAEKDNTGFSISATGDMDGDGINELLIGAPGDTGSTNSNGLVYVLNGQSTGFSAQIDLGSLSADDGFVDSAGVNPNTHISRKIAGGGDVNGDGYDDYVLGVYGATLTGKTFDGFTVVLFANTAGGEQDGNNGFYYAGDVDHIQSGSSVAISGDFNGDGYADVVTGAPGSPVNGTDFGRTYVIFGKPSGFSATSNLSSLNGSNGFQISGEALGDHSGRSLNYAGDVDGDGYDDIIIGAPNASPNGFRSGSSYVVFGKSSQSAANFKLSDLNGSNGFKINGESSTDYIGRRVAGAGDVNGDGFDDLILGARNAGQTGTAYVVFGAASGFPGTLELSDLDGSNGFQISGVNTGDTLGESVAGAGDVNGDGFDDIVVGALLADPNGELSGESYVIFGKASGFGAEFDVSTLNGSNGFSIAGEMIYDASGATVSSAGDLNGDGLSDVAIGAPFADRNGKADIGTSYVIFGLGPDASVNRSGTAASQTLVGSDEQDTLSGLGGDDWLWGHGDDDLLDGGTGADTMRGGHGDDLYIVDNDDDVASEPRGSGDDTVRATASATLGDGIEHLELLANQPITGIGNLLDNTIDGNQAGNLIYGFDGNDTLRGNGGADRIHGNVGDDLIDGGSGRDTVRYDFDPEKVIVNLAAGTADDSFGGRDTLISIEDAAGSAFDDILVGDDSDNRLVGLDGNDQLFGGLDDDTLVGGAGKDTLKGEAGKDSMLGGAGNDYYIVDNAGDIVSEAGGGGIDKVKSPFSFTLGAGLDNLTLIGNGNLKGNGNGLNNTIIGNAGNNTLNGKNGKDKLKGGGGKDTLDGGIGKDILDGSGGGDLLIGGKGNDLIVGRTGTDIAKFSGKIGGYDITKKGNKVLVKGRDGTDILLGVEKLKFAGKTIKTKDALKQNQDVPKKAVSDAPVSVPDLSDPFDLPWNAARSESKAFGTDDLLV